MDNFFKCLFAFLGGCIVALLFVLQFNGTTEETKCLTGAMHQLESKIEKVQHTVDQHTQCLWELEDTTRKIENNTNHAKSSTP